ncbi:cysteine peptidase family C39 domain-containing protein [Paraburkholderia atlantica]|uniref:Subfamily B ATP-binding cassette protein HlyB/CyaB n=1 Tax=Paraburkholderia atlantica TaxID=2654982 RepID=A0A7W8QEW1_PARAM|nr:cysteine peptidase family C39 domain-containing protein [Paraburkholderia atlantica]MBB5429016.1 subfamily B ATP-binding cassette protein HlyB/CyaB [Paraburkholderia atlantica]
MNTSLHAVPSVNDSGLSCLIMMAMLHGLPVDEPQLRHQFGNDLFGNQLLLLAAKEIGTTAKLVHQSVDRINRAPLPAIGIDNDGQYFIAGKYDTGGAEPRMVMQRPGSAPILVPLNELIGLWSGELILCTSKASFAGKLAKFDFTWFIPAIVKYRSLRSEILSISLVLQIISLFTPMFFQAVMDKVLVKHAMQTLNVIAIGLISAIFF